MGVRGLSWSLSPVRITESSLDWLILCNPPIRDAEWQMKVFYSLTSDLWVQVKVKHSTEDSLNLCWGNSVLFVFMEMKDMNKFIRMSCSHDWTRILKRVHQNPLRPGLVLTDFVCPCQKRKDSYLKTKQTKKQTKKTQPKKKPHVTHTNLIHHTLTQVHLTSYQWVKTWSPDSNDSLFKDSITLRLNTRMFQEKFR